MPISRTGKVHTLAVLRQGESFRSIEPIIKQGLTAKLYDKGFRPNGQVHWYGIPAYSGLPDDLRGQAESLLKMLRDQENPGRLILCSMTGIPL